MNTEGYPLHRLNTAQARSWLLLPVVRREMASWLGKNYKTGVVVLSPELRAFALVSPRGQITALKWPYRKFEFHQIANKPSAIYRECACRNFYDPESGGAWGDRDKERMMDMHHPHCQGREVAFAAWQRDFITADSRVKEGRAPQARPDEWIRTAKELEGK
jgi:hypothetical protein